MSVMRRLGACVCVRSVCGMYVWCVVCMCGVRVVCVWCICGVYVWCVCSVYVWRVWCVCVVCVCVDGFTCNSATQLHKTVLILNTV